MNDRLKLLALAGTAVALIVGLPGISAHADTIGPITFESYSTGSVHGQDGWVSPEACGDYDHEIVASYPTAPASFGTKSLRMSNAVTSGCFDSTFSKPTVDEAGETSAEGDGSGGTRGNYFEVQWDFASTVPGSEQPGLSVVASPDRGDGARMSWVQMADAADGLQVNFYDYQSGAVEDGCVTGDNFVFTPLVSGLDRSVPHTIKITMLFVDGPENDVVTVYVDGNQVHVGTSWEDYFRECEGNPTRTVDSLLLRTGGVAAPATDGFGFLIDNLRLSTGNDADGDGVLDGDDDCPNSDMRPFVDANGDEAGETSVPNTVGPDGCTIQDEINACEDAAKNHGSYVSCVGKVTKRLKDEGRITQAQREEIDTAASKSSVGKKSKKSK